MPLKACSALALPGFLVYYGFARTVVLARPTPISSCSTDFNATSENGTNDDKGPCLDPAPATFPSPGGQEKSDSADSFSAPCIGLATASSILLLAAILLFVSNYRLRRSRNSLRKDILLLKQRMETARVETQAAEKLAAIRKDAEQAYLDPFEEISGKGQINQSIRSRAETRVYSEVGSVGYVPEPRKIQGEDSSKKLTEDGGKRAGGKVRALQPPKSNASVQDTADADRPLSTFHVQVEEEEVPVFDEEEYVAPGFRTEFPPQNDQDTEQLEYETPVSSYMTMRAADTAERRKQTSKAAGSNAPAASVPKNDTNQYDVPGEYETALGLSVFLNRRQKNMKKG